MENLIYLMGNLGKDPKVKYTDKGAVAYISLAVADGYGENKETIWHNIQAIGKLAETIGNNLSKGSKVLVRAKFKMGIDKEGNSYVYIRATRIKFLNKKAA